MDGRSYAKMLRSIVALVAVVAVLGKLQLHTTHKRAVVRKKERARTVHGACMCASPLAPAPRADVRARYCM